MIKLNAKIEIISGENDNISLKSFSDLLGETPKSTNTSSDLPSLIGKKNEIYDFFVLGETPLGEGAMLYDKLDFFVSEEKSLDNGNFISPFFISIKSTEVLKSITIAFDTENGAYPKNIFVNGVKYSDDDAIYTVSQETKISAGDGNSHEYEIEIPNWNKPNSPLIISGIYADIVIDLDYSNLLSLSSPIKTRSDDQFPSYGIISNASSMEFVDYNGEIKDYAEHLLLNSGATVEVFLLDTLSNRTQKVGHYFSNEWNYDNDNKSVQLSFKDNLEEWQDINVEEVGYYFDKPWSIIKQANMLGVYDYLYSKTPTKYGLTHSSSLKLDVKNILQETPIEYAVIKQGTLWNQWSKLCEVCGLYLYKNEKGKTVLSNYYGG